MAVTALSSFRVPEMTDWSRIVQQYGAIVWKTADRLLNDEADVEDCFQNAFVSALELSSTQTVRNWPGLLKRLATARALERLRQRYRQSSRHTRLPESSVIDEKATGPDQAAESKELAEHLREALSTLDSRQAQVFCLACLEELSYREIAEQLGVTVNHVGVLLNRARSSLQKRLRSHGASSAERFEREV